MAREILSPLYDYVFKIIFGMQQNSENLARLLKSILDIPVEEYDHLTIVDPFLKRWFKRDKFGILDVLVHTTTKMVINVEIQVNPSKFMRKRIIYYLAKLLWEQIKSGDKYAQLQPVIGIIICNHRMIPESRAYMNTYTLRNNKTGEQFTELIKVIIIELPKVPKEEEDAMVSPWLSFLKGETREEFEILAKKHPEVSDAVVTLKKLSWSDRHRMLAEAKEKWRRDKEDFGDYRYEQGIEQGIEQGSRQALLETARKLKARGVPVSQIAEDTGLSPEDLAGL